MKKNVLSLIEVMDVSKQLMGVATGEKCVSVNLPLQLVNDDNLLECYMTHTICKESEEEEAKERLKELSGLTKKEFIKQNPYCHISSYSMDDAGYYMASFDVNDDEPCKIQFSEGYEYLNYFFYKFNNMRNNLIENKQIVKDDDIYQYLDIVLGRLKRSSKTENRFQRFKNRFINSD